MRSSSIYDVVKPIHLCSLLIGLTAFSIKRNSSRRYQIFLWWCTICWIAMLSIWQIYIIYVMFWSKTFWEPLDRSYMSEFLEKCFLVFMSVNSATALGSIWWMFAQKSEFLGVFEKIQGVEKILEDLNEKVNHAKHVKVIVIILTALKAVNIAVVVSIRIAVSLTHNYVTDVSGSINEFFCIELICLLPLQFAFFMWTVGHRFGKINNFLTTVHRESFLQDSTRNNSKLLKAIPTLYDKLVDIVGKLNFCYSFIVRKHRILQDFVDIDKTFPDHGVDWKLLSLHHILHLCGI